MAAFDWYQATVPAPLEDVLEAVMGLGGQGAALTHSKGRHGYAHRTLVTSADGTGVGEVIHGGTHEHPHVQFTGQAAQAGAELVRSTWPEHFVSRLDSREDFSDEGAFDRILPVMTRVAEDRRVKVGCAGDWALRHEARTLYLGSPSSTCRQRLYDKAAELRAKFAADPVQLAQVPTHLARLEAQVRPADRAARLRFASVEPLAVMGSSAWLRDVWHGVVGLQLEPVQAGKVWRQSDDDRAYAYLLAQYGGLLQRRKDEAGSWACLGLQLGHDLDERAKAMREARSCGHRISTRRARPA